MQNYIDKSKNIEIIAKEILIAENVSLGSNIRVALSGVFQVGEHSRIGNDTEILGNEVRIGSHFFHSSGLRVGGGGRQNPNANLSIGDRCTMHNNFINVCEPIVIGNDVGLSPETSILTHGYWMSVMEGFPASFAGVIIGNRTIIGYRSLLMMGISIAEECVVGAQSVVSKSLPIKGIYAGSPARFIKEITPLSHVDRVKKSEEILAAYSPIARYHEIVLDGKLRLDYPLLYFKEMIINLETFEYSGIEDDETDDLRDFLRKWGIRIYTTRNFKSKFNL